MQFPALKDAEAKLSAKRKQLGDIFAEAGPDMDLAQVKSLDGDTSAKAEAIRQLNDELTDLGKSVSDLKGVAAAAAAAAEGDDAGESGAPEAANDRKVKSFGEAFVESAAYKARNGSNGPEATVDVSLKTLFETGAGWAADTVRSAGYVADAQRPVQVVDLFPQYTTNQTSVVYMEETTFTNNAAEVAEGGAKPEAALALTEQTSPVRKIAVWIPVTTEQLDDVGGIRQYLDNRLSFMIRQRLDQQLISGNGTAPNIEGIENVTGIQTQAKGSDPTPDAIYKAITKVNVTGQASADGVVIHPNDWQDIRLLRTADGLYIWGNPSEAGPERIWGLPVAVAQAATEGTAIVGDFGNFSGLYTRQGIQVKVSDSHDTYFTSNKVAVLAEMRAALAVFRPAAFCTVTGV